MLYLRVTVTLWVCDLVSTMVSFGSLSGSLLAGTAALAHDVKLSMLSSPTARKALT